MNHDNKSLLEPFADALGNGAIASLAGRELIRTVHVPNFDPVDPALLADRVGGAVAGLTLGDAFAARYRRSRNDDGMDLADVDRWLGERRRGRGGRLTASSQMFVTSAEAVLADRFRAPLELATTLPARGRSLRSPGNAVRHTIANLRNGAPWFEAAPASYGNAALPRAVAVGLALHAHPAQVGLAASLDAAVSHASLRATGTAAALAGIVAALVTRPDGAPFTDVVSSVVDSIDLPGIRAELGAAMASDGRLDVPFSPEALDSLKLAIWSQQFGRDLAGVLHAAATVSSGDRATLAVAGALHGATVGVGGLPGRHRDVEGADALRVLARRLTAGTEAAPTATSGDGNADIWFLLDRSGSMSSIAEYVVSGFDGFFASQRNEAGDARVTVVQFDDQDRHDVIVDGLPIAQVPSVGDLFQPRGMTPLYDAIALLLDRAERHGGDDADQLVVILTDGHENASGEWTHQRLFRRIGKLRDRGWTFVFLGANQDSYEVGDRMAMPAGNVSNFRPDEDGMTATYAGLERTVREWRGKERHERRRDADQFWGDRKEAEELD